MCSALYASSLTYTKMFKCKCVIRASVLHVYCARVARCYDANKCDPRAAPCPPSQLSRGSSRYLSVMESSTRGSRKRSQGWRTAETKFLNNSLVFLFKLTIIKITIWFIFQPPPSVVLSTKSFSLLSYFKAVIMGDLWAGTIRPRWLIAQTP